MAEKQNIDARIATMDYNDVPLFVQVVEAGSFTAVAARLGTQKSSVSRAVSRLEEDLGVRLLQRTTRKLALTDAGQTFYTRVRGAVAGVDDAARLVQELGGEPRGIVRLTAPSDSLGLADVLARFAQRYPKIHVELSLTGRIVDLVAEGFDLAVRAGSLADSSLVARRAGAVDHMLFAAPSYLRARGRPKRFADLAKHDCVLSRARGGRATWTLAGPNGEESVEVSGKVTADDLTFLARAAATGLGVALLPVPIAADAFDELEVVLPEYRQTGSAVSVLLPSSTFVPARVALLRDFLVEQLAAQLAHARGRCGRGARSATGRQRLRGS
jgi:DNA-binding transcriptional LysR family regulator